jgi:L-fuconolactonase
MILDAHHHLWDPAHGEYPWMTGRFAPLRRPYTAAGLLPELTAHGVAATVVVQARADVRETQDLLALTSRHPFLAGVVGWVDLTSAQVARQLGLGGPARDLVRLRRPHRSRRGRDPGPGRAGVPHLPLTRR